MPRSGLKASERVVLIFGDADDPHTIAVQRELALLNKHSVVLNIWEAWAPSFTIAFDSDDVYLTDQSCRFKVEGIWFRIKPRLGRSTSETDSFIIRERREFLYGLTSLCSRRSHLMNDPSKQELARNKIYQLSTARKLGLKVPRTWVSTDATVLQHVTHDLTSGLIYKPLSWMATTDGRTLFTNTVNEDDLVTYRKEIGIAPGIYQERIKKACEYRTTLIDSEMFSVRIFSQERNDTRLDWRRNQGSLRYEVCELPIELTTLLKKLVHILGLRYAALDIIETTDHHFVFLEANPAGNWLWLEEKAGVRITHAIANAL